MKKIEAVVRVEKIDAVVDALHALNAPGMMLTRIEGHGRQKGIVEQFRGRQYRVDLLPDVYPAPAWLLVVVSYLIPLHSGHSFRWTTIKWPASHRNR